MTVSLAEPAVGVLSELSELLVRLAARRGGVLGVLPELRTPEVTGWTPATDLVREPYELLDGLVEDTATARSASRHVGAALFWKGYGYWHTVPMALGWALNRRVPVMRFEDTVFKVSDTGVTIAATSIQTAVLPDDPWAGTPGTIVAENLGGVIKEALLDGQRPLIRALGRLTKVGERNLWGSTAEALTHPLTAFADILPPTDVPGLHVSVGWPVDGLIDFSGEKYRRRTCCLWITLPDTDPCATCCVSGRGRKST
ncbi:(2Fe-2S)-binding protein [Streptosporangium sp. KLBMP 9127]|nr:hypothetical protein [Streptosporangium sp. KLBMP 9127]